MKDQLELTDPVCYKCGAPAEYAIETAPARVSKDSKGRLVVHQAINAPVCHECGKGTATKNPARVRGLQEARARLWASKQNRLF